MSLQLGALQPFAQGGNRLCFVHPHFSDRCIKVRRPDFTLADRRRKKGFPKNLKPLSSFDDNLEEFQVMNQFQHFYDEGLFAHISRCYGFEETDMGKGLSSELIRNGDGAISRSLKIYLWDYGYSDKCRNAVQNLCRHWHRYRVPSRDLLLHNIVVQCANDGSEQDDIQRLVVIDGLGSSGLLPGHRLPRRMQQAKADRKVENLQLRIADLLSARERGEFPGTHGMLLHDGKPNLASGEAK
jgi:hypothetical protein